MVRRLAYCSNTFMKKIILLILFLTYNSFCIGQYMSGAMINACGTEGDNEYVFIKNGGSSLVVNATNIDLRYGTASPATTTLTDMFLNSPTAPSIVASLNATLTSPAGCDFVFEYASEGSTIPANVSFLIMRNTTGQTVIDYSGWCGGGYAPKVYIAFSTDASWGAGGEFANTGVALRYFRTIINGNDVSYSYLPDNLSNNDGSFALWNSVGGISSYYGRYPSCTPPTATFPLPVTLVNFSAKALNNRQSQLNWSTANETNNEKFVVERSIDAKSFEAIGELAGKINSEATNFYEFIDFAPKNDVNYYRLKQVDVDGTITFSKIISLNFNFSNSLVLFPNPTAEYIKLSGFNEDEISSVEFFNISSKLLYQKTAPSDNIEINNLPTGKIFVIIYKKDGGIVKTNFIKN